MKSVRCFVPPILSHLKAHVWPSSNHRITFPGARVPFRDEYYLSPPQLRRCGRDRHDIPFGKIGSILDMFHEQLPLPVPCSVFPSYRYEAWTISSSCIATGDRRVVSEGIKLPDSGDDPF